MKIKVLVFMYFAGLSLTACAQEEVLSREAALLFEKSNSMISNSEKNIIAHLSNFAIASNGTQFYFRDDEYSMEFPFNAFVYPLDMNKDGVEEIAIIFGNAATSGAHGSSSSVFIKDEKAHFKANFGFPSNLILLEAKNKEFPDVIVGGPGFEFPVWSWNGKDYQFNRKIANEKLDELKHQYIAAASKTYIESLEHNH